MLLVIDHRDSFTWNLVHALERWIRPVEVLDSAEITVETVRTLEPVGIVLSPGPGRPDEACTTLALVRALASEYTMLGVCLGHQILCSSFGASVCHAPRIFHGRVSRIQHSGEGLFENLPNPFSAARYHSLIVDPATLPPELTVTARADSGEVMAVAHRSLPLFGVQFHPESFLTQQGAELVRSFVARLPKTSRAA